ncbi:MAG: PilZ domain-containing protein [Candidatus Brocadiales bacterium]|nr:PilZ domain-containing protein [Candidatus Brocadiales bacterium]
MYDHAEKRKFIRIEKPYMARFRIKPDRNPGAVSPGWDMVAVNDLGAGGAFFNSSNDLEIGTVLDLRIGFSTATPSIKCDGIVTRVINNPNTSIFGVAAAFTKIDEHMKEMINKVAGLDYIISTPAVLSLAS